MKSKAIITNTKSLYEAESYMSTLLDFERVLDSVHLYAYDFLKINLFSIDFIDFYMNSIDCL